jgi:hypothetical protein
MASVCHRLNADGLGMDRGGVIGRDEAIDLIMESPADSAGIPAEATMT